MYFQNNNVYQVLSMARTKSSKKKAKDGGADKRKGGKRADISSAGTKRLLKQSAADKAGLKVRVSQKAADQGQEAGEKLIKKLAKQINVYMSLTSKQTVQKKDVVAACEAVAPSCAKGAENAIASSKGGRSELSDEGVRRQAKKYGLKYRMTEAAKIAFRGAVEAHIRHLGKDAGCIVKASRRHTVKDRDMEAVRCALNC
jgi:histone H3/H4